MFVQLLVVVLDMVMGLEFFQLVELVVVFVLVEGLVLVLVL